MLQKECYERAALKVPGMGVKFVVYINKYPCIVIKYVQIVANEKRPFYLFC